MKLRLKFLEAILKGIIFPLSQMVFLYKDPKGEHIFDSHRTGKSVSGPSLERKQSSSLAIIELFSSDQQKVEWLTGRVHELEKELALAQVLRTRPF